MNRKQKWHMTPQAVAALKHSRVVFSSSKVARDPWGELLHLWVMQEEDTE